VQRVITLAAVTGALALLSACEGPKNGQNTLRPAGPSAQKIDDLFRWPVWISVVIFVAVTGVLLVAVFKFRTKVDGSGEENPKQVHGNTVLEVSWTILPAVVLIAISIPTALLIQDLATVKPDASHVTAVGKQWWWQFDYLDVKPKVVTSTELHMPVGQQIAVNATACDKSVGKDKKVELSNCNVIHSFWVPELAGKVDAVPGRDNVVTLQGNQPGTYLGQCAEFCGLSHANMHLKVIVESRADYEKWLKNQQAPPVTNITDANGKANGPPGSAEDLIVNKFQCTNCHTFNDPSAVNYGPNLTHFASRDEFAGGTFPVNKKNVEDWVYDAPSMIPMQSELCRLPPPATCVGMPSFSKNTPAGQPTMTRSEASTIADFLLTLQ